MSISPRVTELLEFYPRLFVFLWDIILKNDPTFGKHNDFINWEMFSWNVIPSV